MTASEPPRALEVPTRCGGVAIVFLERFGAPRRLLVVGAGHVGRAVATAAARASFAVTVVDRSGAPRTRRRRGGERPYRFRARHAGRPRESRGHPGDRRHGHPRCGRGLGRGRPGGRVLAGVGVVGSRSKAATLHRAAMDDRPSGRAPGACSAVRSASTSVGRRRVSWRSPSSPSWSCWPTGERSRRHGASLRRPDPRRRPRGTLRRTEGVRPPAGRGDVPGALRRHPGRGGRDAGDRDGAPRDGGRCARRRRPAPAPGRRARHARVDPRRPRPAARRSRLAHRRHPAGGPSAGGRGLGAALAADHSPCTVPVFRGKRGHPVCLTRAVAMAIVLEELPGPTLRDALRAAGRHDVVLDDPGVVANCNTPEQLRQALASSG